MKERTDDLHCGPRRPRCFRPCSLHLQQWIEIESKTADTKANRNVDQQKDTFQDGDLVGDMEEALRTLERNKKPAFHDGAFSADDVASTLQRLVEALRNSLLVLGETKTSTNEALSAITAEWLLAVCSKVPSELGREHLAKAVVDASHLPSETQQQAALFDALGASEAAMEVLFEIASRLNEIRHHIRRSDIGIEEQKVSSADYEDFTMDPQELQRQKLRQEALDASQVAALAKEEADAIAPSSTSGATHTVTRASAVQARKEAQKATKRAAQALKKARDAGAIVDDSELMAIDNSQMGGGGLMGMSQDQVWELQQSLLPEGSRQYYDQQGLPKGTTRVHEGNLERVIIPAIRRDESDLPPRLKINDILDSISATAFSGTVSLNPMQSTVFETAFHSRQNMLICESVGVGAFSLTFFCVLKYLTYTFTAIILYDFQVPRRVLVRQSECERHA